MAFVCPLCDVVLHDGADYSWCPACSLPVDWVDLSKPLWCCDQCDAFVNEACEDWPACAACDRAMARVHVRESPHASSRRSWPNPITLLVPIALLLIAVLASDPVGLVFAAPLVLLAVLGAAWFMVTVLRSIGEIAALASDARTRVVHGLEHACATLLERAGRVVIGGQTHRGGFDLEVEHDGRATTDAVRGATEEAIVRLAAGDAALARHPRCGTSLLVAGMLTASLVLAAAVVALVGGAALRVVIAATTAASLLAWWISRPLGLLAQRMLTVSSRFSSAAVRRTKCMVHASGKRATFVVDVDVDLIAPLAQAPGAGPPRVPTPATQHPRISLDLGVGVTYPLTDWFGLRADVRYLPFVDESKREGGCYSDYHFGRFSLGGTFGDSYDVGHDRARQQRRQRRTERAAGIRCRRS